MMNYQRDARLILPCKVKPHAELLHNEKNILHRLLKQTGSMLLPLTLPYEQCPPVHIGVNEVGLLQLSESDCVEDQVHE
jgi:hypothetical protein